MASERAAICHPPPGTTQNAVPRAPVEASVIVRADGAPRAAEHCTTEVMPDGHCLAGGVGIPPEQRGRRWGEPAKLIGVNHVVPETAAKS